jgi:hypothetical protein
MDALSKYGVTNERLDEVSNFYRYRRESGEVWRRTSATAVAIVEDGQVTGFRMINAGAGYTVAPTAHVEGFDDLNVKVTIEFSDDLDTNGRGALLTFVIDSKCSIGVTPIVSQLPARRIHDSIADKMIVQPSSQHKGASDDSTLIGRTWLHTSQLAWEQIL